ncbi:MAG TPA: hypothetical protein VLC55_04445 [Burkholderiales bacterium]|nr:hypothetical protein [Burkholderiales bacterium]
MYAISHIEAKPGIWCWAVSFRRRGKAYYRHFYYARRGNSKGKALTVAVAWRDRQLSRLRTLSKREFCQIVRTSNHSGVPGVYFLHPKGHCHGVWQAQVRLPSGEKLTKTFSVHKYGRHPAFERAVRARKSLLRFVEDRPYLTHATAKALAKRRRA